MQTGENLLDKSAKIVYDGFGQTASQARFEAEMSVAETKNTFDNLGRIMNISHQNGEKMFADYDIAWDPGNRIVDFDFTYLNGLPKKANYSYDKTSQLVGAKYDFMDNEAYKFDPNGNRVEAEVQGKPVNYRTRAFNRLLADAESEYRYDNEGNRIAKDATKYHWDHRNRLVKVETPTETVEYVYDYKNRLVKRSASNDADIFVHDGWQIVMSLKNGQVQDRYLWGAKQDELLACNDEWMLGDHLNTVRDVVKSDGSVVKHLEYNAFGELQGEPGDEVAFLYTGKLFDTKTGLQWNINRWYDPKVGRWISEDPIGFRGGSRNIFSYVTNNPIHTKDSFGLVEDNVVRHGILTQNAFSIGQNQTFTLNQVNQAHAGAPALPTNWKIAHQGTFTEVSSAIEEMTCCFRPKFTLYGDIFIMLRPSDDTIVSNPVTNNDIWLSWYFNNGNLMTPPALTFDDYQAGVQNHEAQHYLTHIESIDIILAGLAELETCSSDEETAEKRRAHGLSEVARIGGLASQHSAKFDGVWVSDSFTDSRQHSFTEEFAPFSP